MTVSNLAGETTKRRHMQKRSNPDWLTISHQYLRSKRGVWLDPSYDYTLFLGPDCYKQWTTILIFLFSESAFLITKLQIPILCYKYKYHCNPIKYPWYLDLINLLRICKILKAKTLKIFIQFIANPSNQIPRFHNQSPMHIQINSIYFFILFLYKKQ